ncbi:MAG: M48 family metalloprotease [Bacillota bacterium]
MKELFDDERRKLARKYNNKKRKYSWIIKSIQIIFWIIFLGFSLEYKLYQILSEINNQEIILVFYLIFFLLIYSLINWTASYFLIYRLNKKYDLSNQKTDSWWKDKGKEFLLNIIMVYLTSRLFLYLINKWPDKWWMYFSIVGTIFYIIITFIMPYVILPLFYKLEKYPDNSLRKRLVDFIRKNGIAIEDIYEINLSSKINYANAAVIGLGSSRKIILGDNLTDNYTEKEIVAILAHELGHHLHKDIIKNLLLRSSILFVSAYIISKIWYNIIEYTGYLTTEIYTLPLLFLIWSIVFLIFMPLELYVSRKLENKADNFALNRIDCPEDLGSGLAKLADQSLSELDYGLFETLFKASHPSIGERVKKSLNWNK